MLQHPRPKVGNVNLWMDQIICFLHLSVEQVTGLADVHSGVRVTAAAISSVHSGSRRLMQKCTAQPGVRTSAAEGAQTAPR